MERNLFVPILLMPCALAHWSDGLTARYRILFPSGRKARESLKQQNLSPVPVETAPQQDTHRTTLMTRLKTKRYIADYASSSLSLPPPPLISVVTMKGMNCCTC